MDFTHIANPVRVKAQVIRDVIAGLTKNCFLTLEDGAEYHADALMTARYWPVSGDYLVTQDDGYQYLNPKDVFERKYRAIGDTSVIDSGLHGTFGFALMMLKNGHRVARAGWNGKGMWVCFGKGTLSLPADQFWNGHTRAHAEAQGGTATVQPYLIMKNAAGDIQMGWAPTQSDMLAEDWQILQDVVA